MYCFEYYAAVKKNLSIELYINSRIPFSNRAERHASAKLIDLKLVPLRILHQTCRDLIFMLWKSDFGRFTYRCGRQILVCMTAPSVVTIKGSNANLNPKPSVRASFSTVCKKSYWKFTERSFQKTKLPLNISNFLLNPPYTVSLIQLYQGTNCQRLVSCHIFVRFKKRRKIYRKQL